MSDDYLGTPMTEDNYREIVRSTRFSAPIETHENKGISTDDYDLLTSALEIYLYLAGNFMSYDDHKELQARTNALEHKLGELLV